MQSTTAGSLERELSENWWVFLVQGIISLLLGLLLLTAPGATLFSIIVFLGIWWLIDGIFSIVGIFLKSRQTPWGWLLLRGVLGILAGFYILKYPVTSTILVPSTIVLVMGIQGILIGAIRLIEAFQGAGWGAGILGVVSIGLGILLAANPIVGAAALPIVMGFFGIFGGIAAIIFGFQVK